jgi:threonylcarbamoyladenosine tRNA methylthiotransferase MtaB
LQRRLASETGSVRLVLIESDRQGRTEHFLPVAISGEVPGAVRALTVTGHDGARLIPAVVARLDRAIQYAAPPAIDR